MNDRDFEIGNRIKQLRQDRKITQKELAEKLDVSQTAIALWESGSRSISFNAIDAIADILNVSASYLLFGETDTKDDVENKNNIYYLNDDARDLAQFMFENPEYKVLFDASRKVKKEDIEFVKQMIDRMRGTE